MFWPNFSKIDQSAGLLLLFSHRNVPKFLCLKLRKLTWGGGGGDNFGWRRTGDNFGCHVISPKLEKLPDSIVHQKCFYGYNGEEWGGGGGRFWT